MLQTTESAWEYSFKHALTHEVSYGSLLLSRRKELHRAAALAIQELWPDRIAEQAGILGQHYAKAEMPEEAIDYFTRAGDRAASTFENTEAIGFYRQAIEQIILCEPSSTRAAELNERAADLLELTGQHSEARKIYAEATEIRRTIASSEVIADAGLLRKIAKTYETERNFEEALRLYQTAEEKLGDRNKFDGRRWEEWIETRLEGLWVYYFLRRVKEMRADVAAIRDVVNTKGTARQRAVFSEHIVRMRYQQERYDVSDESIALARSALSFREEAGDLLPIGHAQFLLGLGYVCRGELIAAEERLKAAETTAHRTGDLTLLSRAYTYLLFVDRRRGDTAAAGEAAQRLLTLASRYGMQEYVAIVKATMAWIAWRAGDRLRVLKEGNAALERWRVEFVYPFQWTALWPLMATSVEEQNADSAIGFAKQLLDSTQQPPLGSLQAAAQAAVDAYDRNENDKALGLARSAVQAATEMGYL